MRYMKNLSTMILVLGALVFMGLGCGLNPFAEKKTSSGNSPSANTAANKTLTDKAVDTALGEEKIGIPECDEVMDMLQAYMNDPEDSWPIKATKSLVANKVKEGIRTSLEENKTDKAKMAKDCGDFKRELEKAMAETGNSNK